MAVLALTAALAGCGGSGGSSQDKDFVKRANTNCFTQLSRVREAADTTKTNAPRDDVLAQAQQALNSTASQLETMSAPSDKRVAQTGTVAALRASAQQIGHYLRDKQVNEPETSADWNKLIAQLSELQQTAYDFGLKACLLPIS